MSEKLLELKWSKNDLKLIRVKSSLKELFTLFIVEGFITGFFSWPQIN